MSNTKLAFTIAIGERGLLIAINLISYIIVARLVSPEDVGVFSVTSAFVAMLAIIRDFGTGYYIATTKDLTQEKLNTAFTFSFLIGFSVFLLVQAIAYPVGQYFDDHRVTTLLRLMAFNSLILPVTGCLMTSMRRRFMFGRVFWVNLAGALSGAFVTIGLGYLEYGSYALALGVAANYFISAFLAYVLKPKDIKLGVGLSGWREVFSFGGKNSVIGFLQQVSNSLLEVMVGKYFGFVEAGLLSRALGVVNLFNRDFSDAIKSVAIHSFSKAVREGRDVEDAHRVYFLNYTCFGLFYFSFVFFFSNEAIYLLSGEQWLDAVPYLKFYAVMGAATTLYQFLPGKALALGKIDSVLRSSMLIEPVKFVVGAAVIMVFVNPLYYSASTIFSGLFVAYVYWRNLGFVNNSFPEGLFSQFLIGLIPSVTSVYVARHLVDLNVISGDRVNLFLQGIVGGVGALVFFILLLAVFRNPLFGAVFCFRDNKK